MSFPGDRANEELRLHALSSQAVTADANATGVDAANACQEVLLMVNVGAVSGTDPTLEIQVQSSLNNNTATSQEAADAYAAISGAVINLTSAHANTTQVISFKTRGERYLRLALNISGSDTPTFNVSANFVSSKLRL